MCDRHLTDEERMDRPGGPATFVDELIVALTNARIYSPAHPRLKSALEGLFQGMQTLQAEAGGTSVQIGVSDGYVFFQSRPLLGASLSAKRLIETLGALGSGGVAFDTTATLEELHAFVRFVSREARDIDNHEEANVALGTHGCSTVRFLPPYQEAVGGAGTWADRVDQEILPDLNDLGTLDPSLSLAVPTRLYQDVVHVLQEAMIQSCKGQMLDTAPARGYIESVLGNLAEDTTSMMRLARYEKYDAFTFGHSIRVCFIAMNFARHMTEDRQLLERIGLAALLHDVGKAWVPFEVLHSTGRLDEAERREMNMHTVHGGHILLESPDPDPLAIAVAFSHHQNPDGSGYPRAIRGDRASAASMIVKIADVYEALTAVRPYKARMASTRAYRIMMDMKGHFDPSLLRHFIEFNGIYPVGTRVQLTNGETARVHQLTDAPLHPIVRTELADSGENLHAEDVATLDLREEFGNRRIGVEAAVLDAEM